jgi:hypothetical protein
MAEKIPCVVRLDELTQVFARLVAQTTKQFGAEIDLGAAGVNGYYRTVDLRSAYSMSESPVTPDVGDVTEDVNEVRDLLARDDGEVYLWHDIDHFVGVLRALAFLNLP